MCGKVKIIFKCVENYTNDYIKYLDTKSRFYIIIIYRWINNLKLIMGRKNKGRLPFLEAILSN